MKLDKLAPGSEQIRSESFEKFMGCTALPGNHSQFKSHRSFMNKYFLVISSGLDWTKVQNYLNPLVTFRLDFKLQLLPAATTYHSATNLIFTKKKTWFDDRILLHAGLIVNTYFHSDPERLLNFWAMEFSSTL